MTAAHTLNFTDGPATPESRAAALLLLKANGLTFGECIAAFAVPADDRSVATAREMYVDDNIEIDDHTVKSEADTGSWVLGWLWAPHQTHAEVLESILDQARAAMQRHKPSDPYVAALLRVQADWLEDLISNYADELDEIASTQPTGTPGLIEWVDSDSLIWSFLPSEALAALHAQARAAELSEAVSDAAGEFIEQYGTKLDAMLRAVPLVNLSPKPDQAAS